MSGQGGQNTRTGSGVASTLKSMFSGTAKTPLSEAGELKVPVVPSPRSSAGSGIASPRMASKQASMEPSPFHRTQGAAAPVNALGPVPSIDSPEWGPQLKATASKGDASGVKHCLSLATSLKYPEISTTGSKGSAAGGTKVAAADNENLTSSLAAALQAAVWGGHEEVAKLLLDAGAPASFACDSHGNTPLHLAARQGSEPIANALINGGASARATNSFGQTPLHTAAAFGRARVARLLLSHGAVLEAESQEGATPLAEASKGGHSGLVALLLGRGADPLAADKEKKSPLYWAAVVGSTQIVQQMCDKLAIYAGLTPTSSVLETVRSGTIAESPLGPTGSGGVSSSRAAAGVAAIRTCAMAAMSHGHMPAFAILMRELGRRDPEAVTKIFDALSSQGYAGAAAAAVTVAWAEETSDLARHRAALQPEFSTRH